MMAAKVNREANLQGGCGAAAAACEVFLVPGQTCLASLMASTEARKFSWYPARLRRRPQPPRGLGNLQRRVLSLPRPRKRSAACFDVFRGLGWGANMRRRAFPAHPAYLCRRLSGIGMRCERSDTMSDYYLLLRDYSNYYL